MPSVVSSVDNRRIVPWLLLVCKICLFLTKNWQCSFKNRTDKQQQMRCQWMEPLITAKIATKQAENLLLFLALTQISTKICAALKLSRFF